MRLVVTGNRSRMYLLKTVGQSLVGTGLNKPDYIVTDKGEGYEERKYAPAHWVSTTVKNISHDGGRSEGFQRLFKYITGANETGTKIEMTAPVATKIVPGEGPNCENSFTVSFYIPPEHQDKPIPPTNPDVFIEKFPEMTVYATGFGGFAKDDQYIGEARTLSAKIKSKSFNQDSYFTAGYDSPFKLFNRLNEVWFVKKE